MPTPRLAANARPRGWGVVDSLPVSCVLCDADGRVRAWNRDAERLTGWPAGEMVGNAFVATCFEPGDHRRVEAVVAQVVVTAEHAWFEARLRRRAGRSTWTLFSAAPAPGGVVIAALDLSHRSRRGSDDSERLRELEARVNDLVQLAATDGLTGLANHRSFQHGLEVALRDALARGAPLALVLLDVDHFKRVNDTYGHPVGDEVLRGVAEVIRRSVREGDLTSRYGGEEFAAVLPSADVGAAVEVAERARRALADRAWPCGSITLSAGLACVDPSLLNSADLVARADRALYAAKGAGRDRVIAWEALGESPTTRLGLDEWLGRVEAARVDATGSAGRRIVQQAIVDHLQWKNRLRARLHGSGRMAREEIVDHHACRLGRWYDDAVSRLGTHASFVAVAEPHAQLHREARMILEAIERGDTALATESLRELECSSLRIVAALERLADELSETPPPAA